MPDPPIVLSMEARREWDRVCGILLATGVLTLVDRGVLALYCQSWGRWEQAEETLRRMATDDEFTHGLMIKSAKGNPIANPFVGIANVAGRDALRYAAELGMTPSARSRIRATDAVGESDNPFLVLKNA